MRLHDYAVADAGPDVSTLAMVAVYPAPEQAEALAVEDGQAADSLHCTLVFLGEAANLDAEAVAAAVAQAALELAPLEGTVGGVGRFAENPDGVPVLALPDVQGLTLLRERVVDELGHAGVRSPSEHGFLPHMTLDYMAADEEIDLEHAEEKIGLPLTFNTVTVVIAGERYDYELTGARVASADVQVPTPAELTDATARVIERLQADRHVDPLAAAYQAVLEAAGRRMASAFRAQAVALTAAGFVPPDEDEVVNGDRLADEVTELVGEAQREAGRVVVAELDDEGISYDVDTVFTEELLERVASNAAFNLEGELRGTYRTVLEVAAAEGWSVVDAADALTAKITSLAPHTARAIARTELNGLANGGSVHVASKTVGKDQQLYKRWLATDDERTRETHIEANGQAVLVNHHFTVGDFPLSYPGDPFGPPEEVINCRCTVIYSSDPAGTVVAAGEQAVGDSQPSEPLPSHDANEEAPMSATETDTRPVTADGADGEVAMVTPIAWDAVLCAEGETTEDGRLLERGSISWRDLPLTLMGMLKTGGWGHEGAEVSGRIDSISRVADELPASGELTSDFGVNQLAPLIADRTVRGVSIDLAVLDWEYRDRDTGEVLSEDDLFIYWLEGREQDIVFAVLEGTIVGATVCPMPAIANAEITLAASAGLDLHARSLIASAIEGRNIGPDDVRIITVFTPFDRKRGEGLISSAVRFETEVPPRSHFEVSEFPGPTPWTVLDDGRCFGHLATWETCHVGLPGVCVTAPRTSTDPAYALFHQGQWPVAEGGTIDVGKMMLGTGHADLGASRMEATRHYDKPNMVGAYVRAIDGEHGIWVSGVVRPELSAAGLRELRANPPSGDWRSYNGQLELIAACAVAVPGFPVVAGAQAPGATANITAAGGTLTISALVASSGLIVPTSAVRDALVAAGCGCEDMLVDEYVDDLAELSG